MFNTKQDPSAALVAYLGIALLFGAFLFMTLVPKPTTAGLATKHRAAKLKVQVEMSDMERAIASSDAYVQQHAWEDEAQRVIPLSIQTITRLAKENGLQLVGIRPQKVVETGKPNQLPFVITVAGPYPAVVAFGQALEGSNTRLAMTMMQLTSTDGNSNAVTGTIGVLAYLLPPAPAPAAPAKEDTNHA